MAPRETPQDNNDRNERVRFFLLCKNYASHLPKPKLPNREATTSLATKTRTTKARRPWRRRMRRCRRRSRQWKARSKTWISKTRSCSKSRLDFADRARLNLCALQSRGGGPEQPVGPDVAPHQEHGQRHGQRLCVGSVHPVLPRGTGSNKVSCLRGNCGHTPDLFYFFQKQIFNRRGGHRRGGRNVCLLCNGTAALILLCHLL